MLLIFGFTVRFKTHATQVFSCPACGGDRTGELQQARRWFSLFFIPIVPLRPLGEQVRCTSCGRMFATSVLERATTSTLETVLANARRALAVMVVATDDRGRAELRSRAIDTLTTVVPGYDARTLASDLEQLDPALAPEYVLPLADGLEVAGREQVLTELARLACTAGPPSPAQRRLIEEVGRALDLTPVHVTGVLATVEATASPTTGPEDPWGTGPADPSPPTAGGPTAP